MICLRGFWGTALPLLVNLLLLSSIRRLGEIISQLYGNQPKWYQFPKQIHHVGSIPISGLFPYFRFWLKYSKVLSTIGY